MSGRKRQYEPDEVLEWRKKMIQEAREQGFTQQYIAEQIGTTYQNVHRIANEGAAHSPVKRKLDQYLSRFDTAATVPEFSGDTELDILDELGTLLYNLSRMVRDRRFSAERRIERLLLNLKSVEDIAENALGPQERQKRKAGNGSKGE